MGRSRYRILEPDQPHFLTCIVLEWLPVFTRPETSEVLLASLRWLQANAELKVDASRSFPRSAWGPDQGGLHPLQSGRARLRGPAGALALVQRPELPGGSRV